MKHTHVDIDLESATNEQYRDGNPQPSSHSDTAYLDGLRGLAAFLVYLSHNVPWWYGTEGLLEHGFGYHGEHMLATFPFLRSLFTGGAAGVAIFFVLSGYVLSVSPLKMLKEGKVKETRWYLLAAAVRRPFRLFIPVGVISLIFALWMHAPFGLSPHLSWPEPEPTLLAELWKWIQEMGWTINIIARHGQFEHWFPYDPPAWTMAAELKGSLAVFALLAASASANLKQRLVLFAGAGSCALLFYQWELACFMFGVVLAIVSEKEISSVLSFQAKAAITHALFFIGWWLLGQPHGKREPEISYATPGWYYLTKFFTPNNYYNSEFWRWWNSIAAVMLIYGVTKISWIQWLLLRPTLRYLGKISFSLYLIHIPIAWTIGDRIARVLGVQRQDFTMPYDNLLKIPDLGPIGFSTGLLCWQAIVLPLNLVLATYATRKIDEPSVRAGKWIASKLQLSK